ncbi:fimbrial isopeptide formation D2 family protein [Rhodococcus sp. 27YEA15]|uniref:Ig-like domain-containing protein n=1 Tax=Rhodococcus sp. 27YEA15 TaxID=3156259 RepID=UPI003C7D0083
MRPFLRKLALPVAAVTACLGLVLVGSPAQAQDVTTGLPTSSSEVLNDVRYTKTLIRNNTGVANTNVARGGTVTYRIELSNNKTSGEVYARSVRDTPPAGFTAVPDSLSVSYANKTSNTKYESDGGVSASCKDGCSWLSNNWVLKSGQNVTLEVTYQVPGDADLADLPDRGTSVDVRTVINGSTVGGTNPFTAVKVGHVTKTTLSTASDDDHTSVVPVHTGEDIEFTAHVVSVDAPGETRGTVQFTKDGNAFGTPVPVTAVLDERGAQAQDADGHPVSAATLRHSFDTDERGEHTIAAQFTDSSLDSFRASTSADLTVTATTNTTTTISAPATVDAGGLFEVKVVVAPASATGEVQFKDGDTNLGEPVPLVGGEAAISRTHNDVGTHRYSAGFVGNSGYNNSATTATADTVVGYADWTTSTVVEPLDFVSGHTANLTATVAPIPNGGDVTFEVDGIAVGTTDVGTGDGVAVLPHAFDTAGTYSVVAKFNGTAGFVASNSEIFTVTVTDPLPERIDSTTTLAVTGKGIAGQPLTLTATVHPSGATGYVQFKAGATPIGDPVRVVGAIATTTHAFTDDGTYAISAAFVADSQWNDSVSGPTVIAIGSAATDPGGGVGVIDDLREIFGS